jgi:GTP-binding protein HflX
MLFATLSTRIGSWNLGGGNKVLLSDTVGFIRDLPHHLVASFKATLEETIYAHVLLMVLDVADPAAARQFETVNRVLDEIGAVTQPRILVLNKVDVLRTTVHEGRVPGDTLDAWLESNPDAIVTSARDGEGLDTLTVRMLERMRGEMREVVLEIPLSEAKLVDLVEKRTEVIDRDYGHTGSVVIRTRIGRRQLEVLMAGGSHFTADGFQGPEALARLWPEPESFRMPRIPPHLALHQE